MSLKNPNPIWSWWRPSSSLLVSFSSFPISVLCSRWTFLGGFALYTEEDGDGALVVVPLQTSLAFCLGASTAFVASLYLLVPRRIQILDRDDSRQIKWRSAVSALTCVGTAVAYHSIFFHQAQDKQLPEGSCNELLQQSLVASTKALVHVAILYLGPLVQCLTEVHVYLKQKRRQRASNHNCLFPPFLNTLYAAYWQPIWVDLKQSGTEDRRWIRLRNIIIAPITEEFLFRGCLVPALALAASNTPQPSLKHASWIGWTAPLFFGVAHAHHALRRIQQGESSKRVLFQTLFQFSYTTLFGVYASFFYLKTKSLVAVVLVHAFCNVMGLPNMEFLSAHSKLHSHRNFLLVTHIVGLVTFLALFKGCSVLLN